MSQHQRTPRRTSYEKLPVEGYDLGYTSSTRPSHTLSIVLQCALGLAVCLSLAGALLQAKHSANELAQAASRSQGPLGPDFIRAHRPPPQGFGLVYNSSYCNGIKDPQGARKRDCIFDPIHGGWIHRLCSDEKLYKEFIEFPDFGWYIDLNRMIRIL